MRRKQYAIVKARMISTSLCMTIPKEIIAVTGFGPHDRLYIMAENGRMEIVRLDDIANKLRQKGAQE